MADRSGYCGRLQSRLTKRHKQVVKVRFYGVNDAKCPVSEVRFEVEL